MNKLLLIYDDTELPTAIQKKIIGNVKYSQILIRKQTLFSRLEDAVMGKCKIVNSGLNITKEYPDYSFIWIPSFSSIIDIEQFRILLDKLGYANNSMRICEKGKILFAFYRDNIDFDKQYSPIELDNYYFLDISNYKNFIRYLSEKPDTRYFNAIYGDDYQFTKISRNKTKLKSEYTYARLLPDSMKKWIIIPYNLRENENSAEYDMERVNIPDISIRWIHNSVPLDEFQVFLDKLFYFIATRESKNVSPACYMEKMNELYLDKVADRVSAFKNTDSYKKISEYITAGTKYNCIDDILEWYMSLYKKITKKHAFKPVSVICHGDLFFGNMFYDYETNNLKFIDPKGAEKEEDLWTDPYYDVAKLSHSILGNYDFIVNDLFSVEIDRNLGFVLSVDNSNYKGHCDLFLNKAEKSGFDFHFIRLFEASLFLSMLPLHINNPRHILAFILNAVQILNEVENA